MRISDWSSDVCSSDLGFGLAAGTGTAEAQVDDLGDVGVVRYAGNLAARGPDDRVGDVTGVAAAVPEHAHRQDLGVVGDAGHARCVVGQLGAGVPATCVPCHELSSGGFCALVHSLSHGSSVVQSPRSQPPGARPSVSRPETKASVMKS